MTDDNFEHIGHFLINLTRLLLIECVLQIKTIIIIIVFFLQQDTVQDSLVMLRHWVLILGRAVDQVLL